MSSTAVSGLPEFSVAVSTSGIAVAKDADSISFEIDGLRPSHVVQPKDESACGAVLSEARKRLLAVIPFAGGHHQRLGNVPRAYDVAMDMTELRSTVEHEPDDLTVTVDAGVRMGDLGAVLAKRGQWLPIDAPASATVGGVLAANVSGPLRQAYGTARDWVIGMRVAQPDGSISKSGGRVVKNVAGYDMHKLHIGALGTLGVITQVTFKLTTLPQRSESLTARCSNAQAACSFVMDLRDRRLALTAAEVCAGTEPVTPGAAWQVIVRIAGSQAAVERSLRDIATIAGAHGTTVEADEHDALRARAADEPAKVMLRASVRPSQASVLLERLNVLNAGAVGLSSSVCAGVVRCSVQECKDALTIIDEARRHVDDFGGSMFVESAPLEVKREIDVFGRPRRDWEIMRRLKHEFDPSGTLSPGRFAGRV